MSRSDTFDSDILEAERPAREAAPSLPWISAPVLQNTTCRVLLDPRKLLCESSSIVALIPCQTFSSIKTPKKLPESKEIINNVSSSLGEDKPDMDDSEEIAMNVFQSDLLSEILSSATALQLLGSDINILSPGESPSDSGHGVTTDVEVNYPAADPSPSGDVEIVANETENQEALTSWCFEGDDGFRDVIEAINRLCDTMSSVGSNGNNDDDSSNFTFSDQSDNIEDRITEQPKTKTRGTEKCDAQQIFGDQSSNAEDTLLGNNLQLASVDESAKYLECMTAGLPLNVSDSIDSLIYPQTPDSLTTPEVTGEDLINVEFSIAYSSSPAVIDDDSSTNHTDLLQYSLCSSSLNMEDSGLFLIGDGHLPNPEETPPPGHVAAMRVKFETITNVNVNMRLLKKCDDEV